MHFSVGGFNIFAGALLGVCAGLLWTAQGTIMISYPTEGEKGRYFAWFWGIFNMGAVIGSLVSALSRPCDLDVLLDMIFDIIFDMLFYSHTFYITLSNALSRSLLARTSTSLPT